MDFSLDRASGTPIRRQIRGTIEYAIACGDLAIGAALPSVRDLAEQLGVAPMTITQVYNDLKRDGVVEARSGSGTYVADSAQAQMATRPDIDSLHREIDRLIDLSESIGVKTSDLSSLVSHRVAYRASMGRRYSVVMAGLFAEATRSYARHIAIQLGEDATVRPVTIEALQHSLDIKAWVSAADLVITFPNLLPQVAEMFPATSVTSLRFIPSEETRLSLASLDPRTRLGVVSK
ncbi:GntR family transcriptional regulator, partial [Thioclava sp. BHET1]